MYEIYEKLITEKGITTYRLSKDTGIPASTFSDWKKGKSSPKIDKLQKIADYLDVTVDNLLGKEDLKKSPNKQELSDELSVFENLNNRDKKDIAKRMAAILEDLEKQEALMFDGENLDEETMELLKISLENSLKLGKTLAKQKYTQKKYRK